MDIFVANFGDYVGAAYLRLFSRYETVDSVNIWVHEKTGESQGWGFVEMPDEWEAKTAISELNGTLWRGRKRKVNERRPKKEER